jgi:hypothetical protein
MAKKQVRTTRKEDKPRPYKVDYFEENEMIDNDKALVRSRVVRAVTSAQASNLVMLEDGWESRNRFIVRASRFYGELKQAQENKYVPVEDLFPEKKALDVMANIEVIRAAAKSRTAAPVAPATPVASSNTCRWHGDQYLDASGRCTRLDPSFMSAVCAPSVPTSGPDSQATKDVMADFNGMMSHDEHEQRMDNFVPDITPGLRTSQYQAATGNKTPIVRTADGQLGVLTPSLSFPDKPVVPTQPAVFDGDEHHIDLDECAPVIHPAPDAGCSCEPHGETDPSCVEHGITAPPIDTTGQVLTSMGTSAPWQTPDDPLPTWAKVLLFGGAAFFAVVIALAVLKCGH